MKFLQSRFEDYISSSEKYNLHSELEGIYNKKDMGLQQKRNLIWGVRKVIRFLQRLRLIPVWVEESLELLQTGGQSWTDAEKAKIADLNWRIVAEKP